MSFALSFVSIAKNGKIKSESYLVVMFLRLIHQLSRHMFNFKLKTLNSRQGVFKFLFEVFFVICELLNQPCADFAGEFRVGYKADFSEDDYAVDVERPFTVFSVA